MISFDWTSRWYFLLIPAICIFGILTNLLNILVFLNAKMKDISFKYLLVTSISDLFYLVILSYSFIDLCTDCPLNNTYFTKFYDIFLFHYVAASLAIFCILTEIFLSLIRLSVLKKNNYLLSINYFKILAFLFLISFIFYSPLTLFKQIIPIIINKNNSNNSTNDYIEYTEVKTQLGSSSFGTITTIVLQSIRMILAMIILTSINIMIVIEYRKRYSNRFKNQTFFISKGNIYRKFLILID